MVEMIKEMIERVKQPRKLSPSNWRYRLLHWVAGVDHKNYKDGWLYKYQNYFYRAYCPLFWATIILLVTLPITFPVKLLITGVRVLAYFTVYAFGPACRFVKAQFVRFGAWLGEIEARWQEFRRPLTQEEIDALDEEAKAELKAKMLAKDRKFLIEALTHVPEFRTDFEKFWNYAQHNFEVLTETPAKELFVKVASQITKAEEKIKARQAKIKAFILASLHITNILMRIGAYVAAQIGLNGPEVAGRIVNPASSRVRAACLVAKWSSFLVALIGGIYVMFDVVLPLAWIGLKWLGAGIAYLFSMQLHADFWPWFFRMLGWIISVGFGVITGGVLGYMLYKSVRSEPMKRAIAKTGKIAMPPLSIFVSVVKALVSSVRTGVAIAIEFTATLFAENCPPIILVEEEEEEIEAISEHA